MNVHTLEIPATELDLERCLNAGQVFRFRETEGRWVGIDGAHSYCIQREGNQIRVETTASLVALHSFLRLDWNYTDIEQQILSRGPELEAVWNRSRGLRLLRPSSSVETLFTFLCTSNNHLPRITQMVGKLAGAAGNGNWPSLDELARIPEATLRQWGFGYRGATIPLVAQRILERGGEMWFDAMNNATYPALIVELETLPGVGPKLADCIALYAFDRTEATPLDTHLWQAVTRMYWPEWSGTPLTAKKRVIVGEFLRDRFGALAGVAQQVLFYGNLRKGK